MKPKTPEDTVAAIVADYAAGMSSPAVGRKHGISSNTVLRYVNAAGVIRSHEKARALAKERHERARRRKHDLEVGLNGGRWVYCPRRRVQVWEMAA